MHSISRILDTAMLGSKWKLLVVPLFFSTYNEKMYDEGFRKAALRLYDYFQNFKKVADAINIGIATIWRWKNNSINNGFSTRINKHRKFTTFILEFITEILNDKNTFTINEIAYEIEQRFKISFSRQAIATAIKHLGFSRKRVSKRGSIRNLTLHHERLEAFKNVFESQNDKVSIDESGFDFRVAPVYGYSLKNTKCISRCISKQRMRISLIMAIKSNGEFRYKCYSQKVNSKIFETFIDCLPWKSHKFILDNASIHKTENVLKAINKKSNCPLFTPPYTPECNPIENVFSVIKSHFRKMLVKDPSISYESAIDTIISKLNTCDLFQAVFNNTKRYLEII